MESDIYSYSFQTNVKGSEGRGELDGCKSL